MNSCVFYLFLFLAFSFSVNAKFVEYKAGSRIIFVHEDVSDQSYKPSQLNSLQAYQTAKAQGAVISRQVKVKDYHLNPENKQKKRLKKILKQRVLTLEEVSQILRVMAKELL